jgi:hypothetical protein
VPKRGKGPWDSSRVTSDSPVKIDRDSEGKLDPRSPPYGFRVNELGEWEQVPEQIKVIRDMAQWRIVNGASYSTIATRLNEAGTPSPKGGDKGWSGATVWRILRNASYWQRPDPDTTSDPWAAMRVAKVAQITGFLGDEFQREES